MVGTWGTGEHCKASGSVSRTLGFSILAGQHLNAPPSFVAHPLLLLSRQQGLLPTRDTTKS